MLQGPQAQHPQTLQAFRQQHMEQHQLHPKPWPLLRHIGLHPNSVTALSRASISLPKEKHQPKPSGLEIRLLGGGSAAQCHWATHPAPDMISLSATANCRSGHQQGNVDLCAPHSSQCHLLARDTFSSCARRGCGI